MDLGASDEASVCQRDRLVRILLQHRLDVRGMIAKRERQLVHAFAEQPDDFRWTGRIDLAHEKARFGHDCFTTAKRGQAGPEEANGAIVLAVVFGQQGYERTSV